MFGIASLFREPGLSPLGAGQRSSRPQLLLGPMMCWPINPTPISHLPTSTLPMHLGRPLRAWYYNFQYPREEERGLDHSEDLFTPGYLRLQLVPGETVGVVAATELPTCRDPSRASCRRNRAPSAGGGARFLGRRSFAAVAGRGRPISFWCGAATVCTPLSRGTTGSRIGAATP